MNDQDYLNLLPSAFRQKPKFTAMIQACVAIPIQIQTLLALFTTKFDLDTATGQQLDVIGLWVGVSRQVLIPSNNIYFTWDGLYILGWDFGSWQPNLAPADITVLPDATYRTLLRAKIAANKWDGTTGGAYAVWASIFPLFTVLIIDYQNMSYDIAIVGGIVDSLTLALMTGGYIPLKPEGVHVNRYYVPVDTNPLFGWDLANTYINGWDVASWAREVTAT